MKKIFLLIAMCVITLPMFAQNVVSISGTVIDINTGAPLMSYPVTIHTDSTAGFYYNNVVYTNPDGYFQDSILLSPNINSGFVFVSVTDCQQYTHTVSLPFGPGNMSLSTTFSICSSPSGCVAGFFYTNSGQPLTLNFYDQSIGGNGIMAWDFGDGTTSELPNPIHEFPAAGYYTVTHTIGALGTTCWDQETITILVEDSVPPFGCQAFYLSQPDPVIPSLVHFINQSAGYINFFNWNFGDGTDTTVYFPGNPNVSHQYTSPGIYNVCLNVLGFNGQCSDYYCSTVVVDSNYSQCQAGFTYNSIPGTSLLTVQFFDQSVSSDSISWVWNFNDPATGVNNTSTLQNPVFTFSTFGTYNVCLIISSVNCSDTICLPVVVGQNSGCQAQFSYAAVAGASPNVFQFSDESYYTGQVSWLWNFDDGSVSTEQNPVHAFPAGPVMDPYFVCLTITSGDSVCTSTFCLPVLPQNQGCQAKFEALPAPNTPLTMNFTDQSIGINIWLWTWDFGDGTIDTILSPGNPNISHTYQAPGFYNVCLTVQGDSGLCSSTYCETVAVYDSAMGCQAQFTHFPDSSGSGHHIHFIDLSLGNPTSWSWDFGDGTATSNLQNPSHVYSAPGTYTVCLTISGNNCQSVWCSTVEVSSVTNCVNYFIYSQIGNSVNFEGYMLNGLSGTYSWDFGDNYTGTGQNVVHEYSNPGTYYVTLTTIAINGCAYTSTNIISIGDTVIWGQLYGQVFAGNFPATQGMVFLFSVDTNNIFVPFVDIAVLDSAGVYYFPMVPSGNYVIYAIPFESGYLPTYYGNTLNWQNATFVQPITGTPNIPYNINLILSNGFTAGTGSIGGQITQGDYSGSLIDKITMLLKDENGNTILYSQVEPSGTFDFSQLAFGTYYLYAEMAGCETEAIQVIISEANPASMVMLTLSGNSILGIHNKQITLDAGVVYPNPVKTDAQITVKLTTASELSIEIYSMTGQLIYTKTEPVSIGETTVVIPASQLPEGIYMLKMYTSEGVMLTRKLLKTN